MSEIDNMIVPLILENTNTTNANDTSATCEPTVVQTGEHQRRNLFDDLTSVLCISSGTSVIEALDTFENRLSSIGNSPSENITNDPDIPQAQPSNTSDRCESMQSLSGRHIMISYHHDSSFQLCQRIRDRLRVSIDQVQLPQNNHCLLTLIGTWLSNLDGYH